MSKFIQGATYRMNAQLVELMQAALKIEFIGEVGLFTVHEVSDGTDGATAGSVFTDDITSPINLNRCCIPAEIVGNCELIARVKLIDTTPLVVH